MTAEREIGVDPVLERGETKVFEMRGSRGCGLTREVRERRAAPQAERLGQPLGRDLGLAATRGVDEVLEAVEVALAVRDPQQVARRLSHEPVAELTTEPGEVVLQRRERRGRRLVTPDPVDEALDREDAVRLEQEERQHRAPLDAAECEDALAVTNLERSEDSELHSASLVPRRRISEARAPSRSRPVRGTCRRGSRPADA